ncbi:Serine palmitoyltransferase 1 [Gurleya vavrai]
MRLILDESLSIPLLGEKGISSYYNSDVNEIDILIGSLAYAYTGNGGFSAGSSFTVDYQRLSAQSYCFSASMPGFLATNAILNIKKDLDLQNLQFNTKLFHSTFNSKKYKIISNIDSPIICIARINKEKYSIIDEEARLRKIKKTLEDKKIRIGIIVNPFPSIRICIKNDLNESDCKKIVKTICHHIK